MSIVACECDCHATYLTAIARTKLDVFAPTLSQTFSMMMAHQTCDQSHLVTMPQGFAKLK